MTPERLNHFLSIGDRLVLWLLAVGLAGAFVWHDYEAEHNSPLTLDPSPACYVVPAPKGKP